MNSTRKRVPLGGRRRPKLNPMTVTKGRGLLPVGRRRHYGLLDFSSQMVNTNIGHQHPKVVAAIAEQAQKLCTIAPSHATTPDRRPRG